jgi:hypothetical protein
MREGQNFVTEETIDINIDRYTLSKRKGKKYFNEISKIFVHVSFNVKIELLREGTLFRCRDNMAFNKTI